MLVVRVREDPMGSEEDQSAGPRSDQTRKEADTEAEDTEGQALTWKVRKPIPDAQQDDAEGHSVRPPPHVVDASMPEVEEDDAEGNGGPSGNPRPPVD
jgi:hypothetical protein